MKGYLKGLTVLLSGLIMLYSCSTVRKSGGKTTIKQSHTDSTITTSNYRRETTTTEQSEAVIHFPGDSLEATGYMPAGDTSEYLQEIESAGMKIITKVKPGKNGDKVTTKAIAKPRELPVPMPRTTHTVETGERKEQTSVVDTNTTTESWWSKQTKRIPVGILIAAGGLAILWLILLILKMIKR